MKYNSTKVGIILALMPIILIIGAICTIIGVVDYKESKTFRLISSNSNKLFDKDLTDYAKKEGIDLKIDHYGDLEIVDILNSGEKEYDGVWISNSTWLYMLENSYLVTDSKSIAIDPVVMGIKKSKAEELGFTTNEVYNKDILKAINDKKFNYVMTSVTKTNTGATSYFAFLNSLAGSPEVLTSEMLQNEQLIEDLKSFFKGVQRVSGDDEYLTKMFLNGKYDAVINYESSLIDLNKKLESENKETLYLIYPKDGVAINDMPFAFINRNQGDNRKEQFKLLQDYLRSNKVREKLASKGFRSWYGGTTNKYDNVFKKEWGINTEEYLISLKYPNKKVMDEAFNLYINGLRKPTHVVFCLDVSGSMYGDGINDLINSMDYVLDQEQAKKDKLQFSDKDKITIITFNEKVKDITNTYYGNDTSGLIRFVDSLGTTGGTNIYDPSAKAIEILKDDNSEEYTKTVILMTDGQSNNGDFRTLSNYYKKVGQDIPIYSITFGNADDSQLDEIAKLTNAKIFDGKSGLKKAFEEVRSYN
ncbi:MAG: VWA domain-containing protein [Firmicutes bacterium]|nr:VWA domain-containing protein [Bacillota bacterium]